MTVIRQTIPVQDVGVDVGFGDNDNYTTETKFGRNPDVDTGTTPEDLWAGGGVYTGFNATANEDLDISSDDVDDQGQQISSGTATGGSATTLVDSGADFVTTDGVAAGDCLINDTKGGHGIITSVTATTITVFRMVGADANESGDSYRVANANDTGAAVVRIDNILNASYVEQTPVYAILNGTTTVTVSVDAMRAPRGQVVLAGSTGNAEGDITCTQATTHANVFFAIPAGTDRTQVGTYTVPSGKVALVKRVRIGIVRINGSPGSANITIRARRYGETFQAVRSFEVQTGDAVNFDQFGGDEYRTDFKFRIEDVSDNNTTADGAIEFVLKDE